VEKVYEYYTNPDNIKEAWPRDVVKESESVSGSKSEYVLFFLSCLFIDRILNRLITL
jgi:hypothetical protein